MPRIARINISSALYHVICRFVDGRFEFNTLLRSDYLCRLAEATQNSDWRVIAYALMDSHIHLAMISGLQTFSEWIHPLNTGFAQMVNRQRRILGKRTLGPVFAERPTAKVYDRKAVINIISYIHNNPGRAGVVINPAYSRWTSHRSYLGLRKRPIFLDVPLGLHLCGLDDTDEGCRSFHALVCACANHSLEKESIRYTSNRTVVIEPESVENVVTSNPAKSLESSIERFGENITCDRVTQTVAENMGIAYEDLMNGCRRRDIVAARRMSLLVWNALNRNRVEMYRHLKLTSQAASKLLNDRMQCAKMQERVSTLLVDLGEKVDSDE